MAKSKTVAASGFAVSMSIVIEAGSQEGACRKLADRFATIAAHLGNGETLAANAPFFKMAAADVGDAAVSLADPVRLKQIAEDKPAHVGDPDPDLADGDAK